jgi:hypothetical protein
MNMRTLVTGKVQPFPLRQVNWRGRSGRFYALVPLRLHDFSLRDGELYLVALGNHVLWAGSADDIVKDSTSRARFRLALDCADRAFLVGAGTDEVERLTTIWDLEGAEPVTGVVAA